MHAMILIRPDIAFALGRLAQFMAKPNAYHRRMLKNLMRYIRSTIRFKLRFAPGGAYEKSFAVYIDADWAGNRSDRKSISGGVVKFYGCLISWASRKQKSVAAASTESEYISMEMFAKQGQWIAQILKDLGVPEFIGTNRQTVLMLGDNQGALALVKNPQLHERSKHIDICYHFVRDLAEKEKLKVEYIPTGDMVADGMTKPLARVAFERFIKLMGLWLGERE